MNQFLIFLSFFIFNASLSLASSPPDKIKLAVDHLSSCGHFLRTDQINVFTGFGSYWTGSLPNRQPTPGLVLWTPIDPRTDVISNYQIKTNDSAIDMLFYRGLSYILTPSGIEEWDLTGPKRLSIFSTLGTDALLDDEQHPSGFALYKDKIIIAHGRLGVSIFSLGARTVINKIPLVTSQSPLESTAKAVAISGRYAFVALDSYSLTGPSDASAFRGLVVIDMETEKVIREIGDLPPGLDSVTADDSVLILSFSGNPLWKYSVQNLLSAKTPKVLKRVFKFPIDGHPTGKALVDATNYYTCFSKLPEPGQGPFFQKTKTTFNRRQLMLD